MFDFVLLSGDSGYIELKFLKGETTPEAATKLDTCLQLAGLLLSKYCYIGKIPQKGGEADRPFSVCYANIHSVDSTSEVSRRLYSARNEFRWGWKNKIETISIRTKLRFILNSRSAVFR